MHCEDEQEIFKEPWPCMRGTLTISGLRRGSQGAEEADKRIRTHRRGPTTAWLAEYIQV